MKSLEEELCSEREALETGRQQVAAAKATMESKLAALQAELQQSTAREEAAATRARKGAEEEAAEAASALRAELIEAQRQTSRAQARAVVQMRIALK